jgi:uncharacterized protein YdhG (YjbR/CyaY superfamily)
MTPVSSVDAYIAAQPAHVRPRLRELRAIIRAAVPEATEVIKYGMPTYLHAGRRVHFGAAKQHCALYGAAQDAFAADLDPYKTLKGTVQFPLDQPIPEALVRMLVVAKFANRQT